MNAPSRDNEVGCVASLKGRIDILIVIQALGAVIVLYSVMVKMFCMTTAFAYMSEVAKP